MLRHFYMCHTKEVWKQPFPNKEVGWLFFHVILWVDGEVGKSVRWLLLASPKFKKQNRYNNKVDSIVHGYVLQRCRDMVSWSEHIACSPADNASVFFFLVCVLAVCKPFWCTASPTALDWVHNASVHRSTLITWKLTSGGGAQAQHETVVPNVKSACCLLTAGVLPGPRLPSPNTFVLKSSYWQTNKIKTKFDVTWTFQADRFVFSPSRP